MALFGNNIRKIVREFRRVNEYYFNDLSKEIRESFEDLKSEYEENSNVVSEFEDFVQELKSKLNVQDATKLDMFTKRLSRVNRTARHGVEAMWELARNQRKLTSESLRQYEQYES